MAKTNLETKCRKAILDTAEKVDSIYNMVGDVSMKLCHLIKRNKLFYGQEPESEYQNANNYIR